MNWTAYTAEEGRAGSVAARLAQTLRLFGKSERYRLLEELWARYWGAHYETATTRDGEPLAEWDDDTESDGTAVPTTNRKPSIRVNYGAVIVDRCADLLTGTWPALRVVTAAGDEIEAPTKALAALLADLDYWALWAEAVLPWLSTGTVVAGVYSPIASSKRLSGAVYLPFHCTPVFGRERPAEADQYGLRDDELIELRVASLYPEDDSASGDRRWWLWRQTFTPEKTVTYQREDVTSVSDAASVPLRVEREVIHGLGFVPAVWVRTRAIPGEVDGVSLLEGTQTLLDAIDRQESQRSRANTVQGDPCMAPKDSQAGALLQSLGEEGINIGARRILPVPMEILETSGTAQKAQAEQIASLKVAAQERSRIYVHNPEAIKGTLAASALEQLYAPTVAAVRALRNPLGSAVARLAEYALRLAVAVGRIPRPAGLPDSTDAWRVEAAWPGYVIPPTTADAQAALQAAQLAADLVTDESRTTYVAPYLGVADPGAEAAAVAEQRQARADEMFRATGAPAADATPDGEDGDGTDGDEGAPAPRG